MAITEQELADLKLLEPWLWRLLARGALDRNHAFRLCSVATVSHDGWPQSRMVVLRDCERSLKRLSLHSDVRAGKVADLKANPAVTLLFWDKKDSLQLRARGVARLHHSDAQAQRRLAQLGAKEGALYGYAPGPGDPLSTSHPAVTSAPDDALIAANFCWIDVDIQQLEMLHLGPSHTRAVFTYIAHTGQSVPVIESQFLVA